MIWMGDLNVAAERVDVTHPDWFLQQCYQGEPLDMRGQPGFTEGALCRLCRLAVWTWSSRFVMETLHSGRFQHI